MRETAPTPAFVGIDVSKRRLDVCVRPADECWAAAHDDGALPALLRRLVELRPALVCLEATGGLQARGRPPLGGPGWMLVHGGSLLHR